MATRIEDWPAALEALRWATMRHPRDPRPYVALVETHLVLGDFPSAMSVVEEMALDSVRSR